MAVLKTVLVTGATGGLGYSVANYLEKNGFNVVSTGRVIKSFQTFSKFVECDLAEISISDMLIKFGEVDYLIHCAALATDNDSTADYYKYNVEVTEKLINYSNVIHLKKFVYISSPSMYYSGVDRHLVAEDDIIYHDKVSLYATSKIKAEQLFSNAEHRFNTVILRPRAIFGEHDTVLFPKIIKMLSKKKSIFPRAAKIKQDFTYVENVSHAIYCSLMNDVEDCSIFNITNHEPAYLEDILNTIIKHKQLNSTITDMPTIIPKIVNMLDKTAYYLKLNKYLPFTSHSINSISTNMTLSNENAINILKYTPIVSMQDGLMKTLNKGLN